MATGEDRGAVYRRRLIGAAAASCALHMLLFGGLSVSRLRFDAPTTDDADRAAVKKKTDFRLSAPRSAAERPAHERPLSMLAAGSRGMPVQPSAASRERPTERTIERNVTERPAPVEEAPRVRPAESTFERDPSSDRLEAVPQPAPPPTRAAAKAGEAAATAERIAAAPVDRSQSASRGVAPQSATRRTRSGAVASDRQSQDASAPGLREVELLERLMARPAESAAERAPRAEPAPRPQPIARRSTVAAGTSAADGSQVVPVEAATGVVTAASQPASAAAPITRRDTAVASTGRPQSFQTGGESLASDLGALPAPTGTGRPGTRGTSAGGLETGSGLAAADLRPAGSRSPGRDATSIAVDVGGSGAVVATPSIGGTSMGAGGDGKAAAAAAPGAGVAGAAGGAAPAALARGRRGTGAGALSMGRAGGGLNDEETLSVGPGDLAAFVGAGRSRQPSGSGDGASAGGAMPRSPARIAGVALPTDGRVRDVAEAFAGRQAAGDAAGGITDRGVLDRARRMVDRGLDFLVRSQLADGRWRLNEFAGVTPDDVPKLESDTAATGLALLCFLGAGHDHFGGRHRDTVRRGLEFLMSVQQPDGDLFVPTADPLSNACGWLYSHGIASIVLCEAVGMTGDERVRPAAEKACRFIAAGRHPTLGGWRYRPQFEADLSVSGWMLVALRSADLAGVQTDPAALDGVRTLLTASRSRSDPTRFAYNPGNVNQRRTGASATCMTAVGGLMLLHTGAATDDPTVVGAARLLADVPPTWPRTMTSMRDSYLWYYASQVLVHTGGPEWERWYAALVSTLEPEQRRDGPLAGSWNPVGPSPDRWGDYAGRLYVTTMHLMALEVPWRHLPTFTATAGR